MTAQIRHAPGAAGDGQRHIVILALRRSGTTAFWRLLRQHPQHVCFDEPLSPLLAGLPRNNAKRTWDEFIALRARDPRAWTARYAPLPRAAELDGTLSHRHVAYLRYLATPGPLVIDETRATGKLAALRAALGPAVFVHLHRHPVAFASSHMIASQNMKFMRQTLYKTMFFRRRKHFNAWGMEDFFTPPLRARTAAELAAQGVVIPEARAPAVHKLLALWLAAYRRLERDGRRLAAGSFQSLAFEDLCAAPQRHLAALCHAAGRDPYRFDAARLRAAAPGHRPEDPRWRAAAVAVGFSEAELGRFFPGGGAA